MASNVTSVGRGAAVSEYVGGEVLLCGGRDNNNQVLDSCMGYNLAYDKWETRSLLAEPREEAASVVVAGEVSKNLYLIVLFTVVILFRCHYYFLLIDVRTRRSHQRRIISVF